MFAIPPLKSVIFYCKSTCLGGAPLVLTHLFLRTNHLLNEGYKRRVYASCLFLTSLGLYYQKLAWKVNLFTSFFFLLYFDRNIFGSFNPFIFSLLFTDPSFKEAVQALSQAQLHLKEVKNGAEKVIAGAIKIAILNDLNNREMVEEAAMAVEEACARMKGLKLGELRERLERQIGADNRGLTDELEGETSFQKAARRAESFSTKAAVEEVKKALSIQKKAFLEEEKALLALASVTKAQEAVNRICLQIGQEKKKDLEALKEKRKKIHELLIGIQMIKNTEKTLKEAPSTALIVGMIEGWEKKEKKMREKWKIF